METKSFSARNKYCQYLCRNACTELRRSQKYIHIKLCSVFDFQFKRWHFCNLLKHDSWLIIQNIFEQALNILTRSTFNKTVIIVSMIPQHVHESQQQCVLQCQWISWKHKGFSFSLVNQEFDFEKKMGFWKHSPNSQKMYLLVFGTRIYRNTFRKCYLKVCIKYTVCNTAL